MTERIDPTADVIENTLRGQAPDDITVVTALISELMASGALDEEPALPSDGMVLEAVR
jgi:hypothetical protein